MSRASFRRCVALACLLVAAACGPSGTDPHDGAPPDDGAPLDAAPFEPAAHSPFPTLPRGGDAEIATPRLVTVVATGDPLGARFEAFADAMVHSAWWTAASHEYGVGAFASPVVHLTGPAASGVLDGAALRAYVNALVGSHPEVAPDGSTIYLFLYPPGASRGDGCSETGAHEAYDPGDPTTGPTDALAWVQRCTLQPAETELDALTTTASHETVEAATDSHARLGYVMPPQQRTLIGSAPPWSVPSWSYYQDGWVEDGDLCEGTEVVEGGFAYQRSWSLAAAAAGGDPCVPAIAAPYYSVSTEHDWITVPVGTTTMVPLTGWSTGPRDDWSAFAYVKYGSSSQFAVDTTPVTLNNGRVAQLAVTAPPTPGEFATIVVVSYAATLDPLTHAVPWPEGTDALHVWSFGVHTVPAMTAAGRPTTCGDGACATDAHETCGNCPDDCGACGAICGAAEFGNDCGDGHACPAHASCAAGGGCTCNTGFTAETCLGAACPAGGCTGTDWGCVPSACGASDFTTTCTLGSCPAGALCGPRSRCLCGPGMLAVTCSGTACPSGGCSYPDYICTTCGSTNDLITCSSGSHCPAFSTCGTHGCDCIDGYMAVACDGRPCDDTNCLGAGQWWCVPEPK